MMDPEYVRLQRERYEREKRNQLQAVREASSFTGNFRQVGPG